MENVRDRGPLKSKVGRLHLFKRCDCVRIPLPAGAVSEGNNRTNLLFPFLAFFKSKAAQEQTQSSLVFTKGGLFQLPQKAVSAGGLSGCRSYSNPVTMYACLFFVSARFPNAVSR